MNKYIDADKLTAQIKGIIAAVETKKHPDVLGGMEQCLAASEVEALSLALDCIKELQQEQADADLKMVVRLDNIVMNMVGEGYNNGYKTRPFYEEVLRRFNENKEK